MTVQEKAEEAVDRWLEYSAEEGYFDKDAIVENATESAMQRLDDDDVPGDDDHKWDYVNGAVERVYERKRGDYE